MARYKTTAEFKKSAERVHEGLYDYSETEYINHRTKVCIICRVHGRFLQVATEHLRGYGCTECALEYVQQGNKKSTEKFIEQARAVHGNAYAYSNTTYSGCYEDVCITCPIHGDFWIMADRHTSQGSGCQICGKQSKGEAKVAKFLSEHRIEYEREKRFETCRHISTLPFDFFLPEYKLLIEFDGAQHYEQDHDWYTPEGVRNDKIKNEWAKNSPYKLIRIRAKNMRITENILCHYLGINEEDM